MTVKRPEQQPVEETQVWKLGLETTAEKLTQLHLTLSPNIERNVLPVLVPNV